MDKYVFRQLARLHLINAKTTYLSKNNQCVFVFFREDDKNDDDKNNNENSHINIATGILCNTRPYEKMKIEMMG